MASAALGVCRSRALRTGYCACHTLVRIARVGASVARIRPGGFHCTRGSSAECAGKTRGGAQERQVRIRRSRKARLFGRRKRACDAVGLIQRQAPTLCCDPLFRRAGLLSFMRARPRYASAPVAPASCRQPTAGGRHRKSAEDTRSARPAGRCANSNVARPDPLLQPASARSVLRRSQPPALARIAGAGCLPRGRTRHLQRVPLRQFASTISSEG